MHIMLYNLYNQLESKIHHVNSNNNYGFLILIIGIITYYNYSS